MNRCLFPLLAVAALFVSCQAPEPGTGPVVPERYEVAFTASVEDYKFPTSKSGLDANMLTVNWHSSDRIRIWTADGKEALYGPACEGRSANLLRYGCEDGFYGSNASFAFTPASWVKSFSHKGGLVFNMPSTQTLRSDLSALPDAVNPSAAVVSGGVLHMGNVCSLLDISVRGDGTVSRLVVRANGGEMLCGDFCLDAKKAGTDNQFVSYVGGGGSEIVIDCGPKGIALSETGTRLKVFVPAGMYRKGFEVVLHKTDGRRVEGIASLVREVRRGQIVTTIVDWGEEEMPTPVTGSIENDAVRDFIDFVYANPYTTENFTVSYVDRYYKVQNTLHPYDRLQWGDRPAPVRFSWSPVSGSLEQTVTVARDEAFSQLEYTSTLSATDSMYAAYNLIPGRAYHVKVTSVFSDNSTADIYRNILKVSGRRRMISVSSIGNVRDLGGLRTCDGRKQVRYGLIFRGSRLNNNSFVLTPEDKAELKRLGIRADADLRENTRDKLGGDIYGKGISPLGEGVDFKVFPKTVNSFFKYLMANDEFIKALQWIIDELKAGKPVYFHCKTGADRTGTLAFLIESLLDISETDKSIDYELTSFFFDFGDPGKYAFRSRSLSLTQAMGTSTTYDWAGMHNVIEGLDGADFQQKTYNYFNKGVGPSSATISAADLDWFIGYMLEPVSDSG